MTKHFAGVYGDSVAPYGGCVGPEGGSKKCNFSRSGKPREETLQHVQKKIRLGGPWAFENQKYARIPVGVFKRGTA